MKRKKRAVTMIEIMIVILLIGLIGGALAVNMRGSLDKGKAFKSEQNILRVENILELKLAEGEMNAEEIKAEWETLVANSPLAKGDETTKDGWKTLLKVDFKKDKFQVVSDKLTAYKAKHK